MENHDNTVKWFLIAILLIWTVVVLVAYVGFHPEHYRPYYHLLLFLNHIVVFVFFVLTSFGLGRLVLVRLFRFNTESTLFELLASLGIGFAILSYTAMFLGFVGLLRFSAVIPVVIFYFLAGAFELKHLGAKLINSLPRELRRLPGGCLTFFLLFILLVQIGMNCIESFTPPYEWDTLSYHLYCQKEYVEAGRIVKLPFIHQSYYACGMELVYGLCLILQSQVAPKLLHCFFGLMTLLLIYEIGRRFVNRFTGLLAAVIFYTCPIPVWFSGVGKNDLASLFFITLVFYTFLKWWHSGEDPTVKGTRWLPLLIFFSSMSIHFDYRGLITLTTLVLFIIGSFALKQTGMTRSRLVQGITWIALSLVIASPWYLKNVMFTGGGSPFFPFLTSWFGGVEGHAFDSLLSQLRKIYTLHPHSVIPDKSIWYYLSLPLWKFTIVGRNYDLARFNATITPLYLFLVPLFVFARKTRHTCEMLTLGLVYIVITQITPSNHTRYLAPALPLLSIIGAYVAVEGLPSLIRIARPILLAVVLIVVIALLYDSSVTFIRYRNLEYAMGILPAEEYVTLRSEIYPACEFINEKLPRDSRILFLSDERLYYVRSESVPLNATRLAQFVAVTGEHALEEWRNFVSDMRLTHIVYNPEFHQRFEQVKKISSLVDDFFRKYRAESLEIIYNQYGIEIYKIKNEQ